MIQKSRIVVWPLLEKKKFNRIVFLLSLLLIICATYLYFALLISNKDLSASSQQDYYVYLINAFIHGRVNITPLSTYDLSLFKGKWYMYWGPAPAIFILLFYIVSRLHASDIIYTLVAGIVNVVLFYFVIQEFKTYFGIEVAPLTKTFLLLSFAFASPNFFLSLTGSVWFTDQVIAITYLLLFYFFYLKFLNSEKYLYLILGVICFNLAWLSRYDVLFNGFLFLYIPIHYRLLHKSIPFKALLAAVGPITCGFISLELIYNFLKFHSLLETGLRYQIGNIRYDALVKSNKILSFQYFWYNFYYYFLSPVQFILHKPFVMVDGEGNSVFIVYPALLLLARLFFKRTYLDKRRGLFLLAAALIVGLNTLMLLLYYATGWKQFGNRYFFDVVPLLFLLTLFILKYIPVPLQIALLLFGIFVNFAGILSYYGIPHWIL